MDSLLLGMRVRISPGAWMMVACECHVLQVPRRAGQSSVGAQPSVNVSLRVCVRACVCV
jgi:hypothetical protein